VIYNDLKIDRHNNLWISTSHIDETEKKGSLWKLDKNKNLQLIDTGFKVSNGPAFSPCGKYIYFNDTFAYQTYRYKLSKENNNSIEKEIFYKFDIEDGYPDGITVDEEGSIWITHWGSGIITKQSPSGDIVKKFNLPSINLTSLCFGGKKFKDLVVTSATDGMEEKDWKNFPESGKTFLIKTKEKGIKENSYST
jgi:sugar lactone lactonase YvrE